LILKGTEILDGCVGRANSLINKKFEQGNTTLAGNPTKIVKEHVGW